MNKVSKEIPTLVAKEETTDVKHLIHIVNSPNPICFLAPYGVIEYRSLIIQPLIKEK